MLEPAEYVYRRQYETGDAALDRRRRDWLYSLGYRWWRWQKRGDGPLGIVILRKPIAPRRG